MLVLRYSYMCMQSRIPSKELRVLYTWETCTHKVIMQDTCLLHTTLNSSTPEALGVSTIPATFQRTHKPTIWKLHSLDFYHLTPSQLACKLHLIKRQKDGPRAGTCLCHAIIPLIHLFNESFFHARHFPGFPTATGPATQVCSDLLGMAITPRR